MDAETDTNDTDNDLDVDTGISTDIDHRSTRLQLAELLNYKAVKLLSPAVNTNTGTTAIDNSNRYPISIASLLSSFPRPVYRYQQPSRTTLLEVQSRTKRQPITPLGMNCFRELGGDIFHTKRAAGSAADQLNAAYSKGVMRNIW